MLFEVPLTTNDGYNPSGELRLGRERRKKEREGAEPARGSGKNGLPSSPVDERRGPLTPRLRPLSTMRTQPPLPPPEVLSDWRAVMLLSARSRSAQGMCSVHLGSEAPRLLLSVMHMRVPQRALRSVSLIPSDVAEPRDPAIHGLYAYTHDQRLLDM